MNLKIGNINIENSTYEKLLGVNVDNKLNFNDHLDGIIEIFPFTDLTKRRLLMNLFLLI